MHAKITLNVIITWLCQDDEVLSIKNGLKSIGLGSGLKSGTALTKTFGAHPDLSPEGALPDIYPVWF